MNPQVVLLFRKNNARRRKFCPRTMKTVPNRHGRPCEGHPRPSVALAAKSPMAKPSPGHDGSGCRTDPCTARYTRSRSQAKTGYRLLGQGLMHPGFGAQGDGYGHGSIFRGSLRKGLRSRVSERYDFVHPTQYASKRWRCPGPSRHPKKRKRDPSAASNDAVLK
jgi:hypothetical protein